jgi:DNA-directed RNA polymerase subunit beta'
MEIPSDKQHIIEQASEEVRAIQEEYQEGLITDGERYNKVIDVWTQATDQVAQQLLDRLGSETVTDAEGEEIEVPSFNSIYIRV